MSGHRFQFTIARSAITSAHDRLAKYRGSPPTDATIADLRMALDAACVAARVTNGLHEIVDQAATDSEEERYVAKLSFPGESQPLIAVIVQERRPRLDSGELGLLVITTCTYAEAHKNFQRGLWRTVDGESLDLPATVQQDAPAPRGGTMEERRDFVLDILRREPEAPTRGKDSISSRMRARFGTGTRDGFVAPLRALVRSERPIEANDLQVAVSEQVDALIALQSARTRATAATSRVAELVARI